jgi:hypothetical protein
MSHPTCSFDWLALDDAGNAYRTPDRTPEPIARCNWHQSEDHARSHFRHLLERDWIPQVPFRAPQDNVTGIVAPLERIGGSDGQHSPHPRASTRFRNGTHRTMISASKCRPLNSAGRLRLMQAEAYQGAECRCNTAIFSNALSSPYAGGTISNFAQ